MVDVRARLGAADLAETVQRLGFRTDDGAAVLAAAARVVDQESDLVRVGELAQGLVAAIGSFDPPGPKPFDHPAAVAGDLGVGVAPLLALLATAPEVAAFHQRRGVPDEVSAASLSDLGQQAWVHRRTYGEFGLHTYPWLQIAWSGALYWLGRLQFNLHRVDAEWVLSTHIPASGPLTPAAADASFRWARTFFARHFPDYPTADFHCSSWLLDPHLPEALGEGANLAAFQRRWRLTGEPAHGDGDVLFFVFSRRGPVDLTALPQQTSLQRTVVERLSSGRHWQVWQGRFPQTDIVIP